MIPPAGPPQPDGAALTNERGSAHSSGEHGGAAVPRSRFAGLAPCLTAAALGLLLLTGLLGDSAAKVGLGERGWAPGALPWALGPAGTTTLLAAAYVLGGLGLLLGLRAPRAVATPVLLGLATACLLTMPFGSADHTNYAAYGRIALQGGDPWTESPIAWHGGSDPVSGGVQPPWQTTPSIYGPLATAAQLLAAWVGGDNLRQVVWAWQWLIVAAWLGTRWLLRRLFPDAYGRIDLLWTLNPLVVGTGVLGAHVDTLATPLMIAALLLARRAGWPAAALAGAVAGLAIGIKVTAGVVLIAIVLGWVIEAAGSRRRPSAGAAPAGAAVTPPVWRRVAALLAGTLLITVPLQAWAGPHAYDQLGRSRRSISLATPWRKIYEWFGGHLPDATWRSLLFAAAALTCLALAWLCWRAVGRRGHPAVRLAFALSVAYAVGAPYVLPWYDQLVWALLPGLALAVGASRPAADRRTGSAPAAGGRAELATAVSGDAPGGAPVGAVVGAAGLLERVWILRGVMLALAYVPGRVVGLTPRVEELTLFWRGTIAPVAAVLVAAVLVAVVRTGAGRPPR